MSTRLFSVIVDSIEPHAIGRWWAGALDWPILFDLETVLVIAPAGLTGSEGVPGLAFVPVPEPKVTKNRVHLDLSSRDAGEYDAIVGRLRAAGATPTDIGQKPEEPWTVLADPEGNEFCVLEPAESRVGDGTLAAVVMDVLDPVGLADFWAAATGRTVVAHDDGYVTLRHPDERMPDLDLLKVDDPKLVKNRLHFDVAPGVDDDQGAEVERMIALGATRIDVGQPPDAGFVVLADPEGNELCILGPR